MKSYQTPETSSLESQLTVRRLKFLWLVYVGFVFYGCLIPFRYDGWDNVAARIDSIGWTPFVDADGSRASIPDVVQNVLFFVPFGFLGFLVLRSAAPVRLVILGLLASLLSVLVESLQLFTVDRTTSITDVVTNFSGAMAGASFAWFLRSLSSTWLPQSWRARLADQDSLFLLTVGTILVALSMLQPFDFALDVGMAAARVRSLLRESVRWDGVVRDEAVLWLHFLLLGYASQLFFQQAAGRGPGRTLLALSYAALLAVALEAVQVIVSSRFPEVRDMLVVAGGALSGVVTCKLLDQRIRSQTAVALLLAGTTVAAAVQKFSPFRWSEQYREFNWVPFLPYYEVTTFVALSNFVESLLIYLPLGFVTEYLFPRQRVIVSITLFIVGSVFLLEFLQGCVEGRYPDITDVLGAGCGGIFGCWIAQTRPARQ